MKTKVVKPHHATDETQLELRFNDIVYVLEQDDSGWWGGHKEGEDCTGWFPGSCVRETSEEESPELASEPGSEPPPMGAGAAGLVMVPPPPEENVAADPIHKVCKESLDLDAQDPLHRDNRLVASPSRRVSSGNPAPSPDSATALANLQVEYRNVLEEHTREIQHLQTKLADANAERAANASGKWRTEELQRQCQTFKKENEDLQMRVQELSTQLEARSSASRLEEKRAAALQEQLTKSQQESRDSMNECAQLRRRLQEKELKESELLKAKESARATQEPAREPSIKQLPQRRVIDGELPRSSPPPRSAESKTPLGDDARRRLFPSTADAALGMLATEKDLAHSILDVTAEEVSNVSGTMETVPRLNERLNALNALRQPPQPPAGARQAPAGSAPRPGRSNSLTRPAFRPSPSAASSSMLLSPGGLAKCLSTGDLPPTPQRLDAESEIPAIGSVKQMTRLFEQRCSTPDRSRNEGRRPATDGDLSFRALAPLGQRSPATEQRLGENPNLARSVSRQPFKSSEAAPRAQHLPGLDMQEAEDVAEYQVNFNMSPMKRHA